eukprot:6458058-Amphidinium_carterae.1
MLTAPSQHHQATKCLFTLATSLRLNRTQTLSLVSQIELRLGIPSPVAVTLDCYQSQVWVLTTHHLLCHMFGKDAHEELLLRECMCLRNAELHGD